jgi:3-dehydroquinate synthase class II
MNLNHGKSLVHFKSRRERMIKKLMKLLDKAQYEDKELSFLMIQKIEIMLYLNKKISVHF